MRGPDVSAPDILLSNASLAASDETKEEITVATTEPKTDATTNGSIGRSKSKRGKNKIPEDKGQSHHKGKGRAKDGAEPERECTMM